MPYHRNAFLCAISSFQLPQLSFHLLCRTSWWRPACHTSHSVCSSRVDEMRCTGGREKASSKETLFVVENSRKKNRVRRIELENRLVRGVCECVVALALEPLAHYRTPSWAALAVSTLVWAIFGSSIRPWWGCSVKYSLNACQSEPDGMLKLLMHLVQLTSACFCYFGVSILWADWEASERGFCLQVSFPSIFEHTRELYNVERWLCLRRRSSVLTYLWYLCWAQKCEAVSSRQSSWRGMK